MIIDGKAIAGRILESVRAEISTMEKPPRLTVFTCAPNFETQKFLALKQRRAQEVGVTVEVISLDPSMVTVEVIRTIQESLPETDGVIVQLPFPASIDIQAVLISVPASYDVDALLYAGEETDILPPVVGAIDAIAEHHQIQWQDKKVVVVGQGRLVGAPAASYADRKGAEVVVLKKDTDDNEHKIKTADILILGAGVPGLVTADMVQDGVVVFDAGTSEEGGMLVGDASPDVASKAALLTPVPGGIGPITIAILLKNVLKLAQLRSKEGVNML
jgi:methylenetetrahydrofolate dehydrogenase (NADP+) / methenyltetrahydrofolate cyclohydrolase